MLDVSLPRCFSHPGFGQEEAAPEVQHLFSYMPQQASGFPWRRSVGTYMVPAIQDFAIGIRWSNTPDQLTGVLLAPRSSYCGRGRESRSTTVFPRWVVSPPRWVVSPPRNPSSTSVRCLAVCERRATFQTGGTRPGASPRLYLDGVHELFTLASLTHLRKKHLEKDCAQREDIRRASSRAPVANFRGSVTGVFCLSPTGEPWSRGSFRDPFSIYRSRQVELTGLLSRCWLA